MVDYDPFSDDVMRDPWPVYGRLRAESPVHYSEQYDTWFLSRFDDIWQSTQQDLFSAEQGVTPEMVMLKAPPPPAPVFTMLDLPRQRPYRRMLAPPYARKAIAALEQSIRDATRERLAPLAARGKLDVYRDLANPVAAHVIGELIGLPPEQSMPLRELVQDFFAREPGQVGSTPQNQSAQIELLTRIAGIVSERREAGVDPSASDHISVLSSREVDGAPMSTEAVTAAVFSMLVTGAEVVPLAVANTAYYLARHPEQRRDVVEGRETVEHAFAESLRIDQPTNLLGRTVKHPVELRGQRLQPGQGVMFLWASGNRDEAEFERADCFEIARRPRRTLSYGHGLHKCIGEHLGNLEGTVVLEELLAVAPDFEIVPGGPERAYSEFLHGYHRMPIEFTPRAIAGELA